MSVLTMAGARPGARVSPDTGPRWTRLALPGVLLLAAVLYGWGLSRGGYANEYYAAAVRSGASSWKAFFFGSLDSASFITVDKPPMALWVQELFARIFGFGSWSLLLPSVLMGVAAVGVLYATVRRGFGPVAGLLAALVMTLTPITVAINQDNNPDTLLVLLLVLAAWACQRAVASGRLGWLSASAFFLGCGFNTKMLQAYLLLPALFVVYLFFAPGGWPRRVWHLTVAGVVLAVSSFWWMVVVDLIPAGSRPYIGGSTDNTVWDLVIGYNGLGRVFGGGGRGPGGGAGGGPTFAGTSGWGRLFNEIVGGQISWLLPFATIALVVGVATLWRRPRTDARRAAVVLWGGWLVVHFTVFSLADGIMHPYYTTALAPAIGALAGIGTVLLTDAARRQARARGWLLVLAVAVTGAWSFVLLRRTPSWHPWLAWTVAALTVAAIALMTVLLARAPALGGGPERTGYGSPAEPTEPAPDEQASSARNTRGTASHRPVPSTGPAGGPPGEASRPGGRDHQVDKDRSVPPEYLGSSPDGSGYPAGETSAGASRNRGSARSRAAVVVAVVVVAVLACLGGPAAYAVSAATSGTNGSNPLAGPSAGGGIGGPGMRGGAPPAAIRELMLQGRFPGGPPPNGAGAPGGTGGMGAPSGSGGSGASGAATGSGGAPGRASGGTTGEASGGSSGGANASSGANAPGGVAPGGGGFGQRGGPPGGGGPGMDQVNSQLISYLEKHRDGATWLVAVSSAQSASPIIVKTGLPVIAMGGFSGSDPAMTVPKLQSYVHAGKLHYVLTGGGGGPGGGGNASVTTWVTKNCSAVKASEYAGGSASAQTTPALYRCG